MEEENKKRKMRRRGTVKYERGKRRGDGEEIEEG
jgi:hypothetical protein